MPGWRSSAKSAASRLKRSTADSSCAPSTLIATTVRRALIAPAIDGAHPACARPRLDGKSPVDDVARLNRSGCAAHNFPPPGSFKV